MAERIKAKMLEDSGVDFIAGPDAYRDLPRLVTNASTKLEKNTLGSSSIITTNNDKNNNEAESPLEAEAETAAMKAEGSSISMQRLANVQLSLEETYADISPVRLAEGNNHAFVTITRGCNNHCGEWLVVSGREWE